MKQIILDFLRRWFGAYLFAVLFGAAMLSLLDLKAGFRFVGILMLPFGFELGRRPVGVLTILPVSRRTISLSYWFVAVILPTLLMAGIIALDGLVFHSFVVSLKSAAMVILGSLAFAGSGFYLLTFTPLNDRESSPRNFLVVCFGTFWFLSSMFGIFDRKILNITPNNPIVYLTYLIGLLLTVCGYSRCEKLLFGRTRKSLDGDQCIVHAPNRMPDFKPGKARFKRVFFDLTWKWFLICLFYPYLMLIFKAWLGENLFFWAWLGAFCTFDPSILLSGGVRLLRSLPLSAGRLALTLWLLPILSFLAMIAGFGLFELVYPGSLFGHYSVSLLIALAGIGCIASTLFLPLAEKSDRFVVTPLAMLASFVLLDTGPGLNWLAACWWLLGFFLMVAAFLLNRHWLLSSYTYRGSSGNIT